MRNKISAIVVVKNEEKNIKKCLESIKWVDEIIFIDNYSDDNTVNIARKYTNKIFKRKGGLYNLIEDNKNFGIRNASCKWVFIIDADEIITKEGKEEILQKIQNDQHDAFYFNFKQYFFGKEFVGPLWTKTKIIRLFKKGKGYYKNLGPHNTLDIDGSIGRIESPIIHDGYPDVENFIRKMNNYTTWGAKLIKDTGKGGLLNKKIKEIKFYNLFLEPALFLPYYFFVKKNYKDGIHGLLLSVFMSFYLFTERSKLWLLKQNERSNKKNL